MYTKELYKNTHRFNEQYKAIHDFLAESADRGVNEHFHWGRFRWHMGHNMLNTDRLTSIALFRNSKGKLCGLVTYDTGYDDRSYVLHNGDRELVEMMVEHVVSVDGDNGRFMVNSQDVVLPEVLLKRGFSYLERNGHVLRRNLGGDLRFSLPDGFVVTPKDHITDMMKYQMVIYKGFDHENKEVFEPWDQELIQPWPHDNDSLRVFIADEKEYCAHCGIWYEKGHTAYIEPVVTIPRCRRMGLGKAVVYEAMRRVRDMGAKRAVVLSDQPFYYGIGFAVSSGVNVWGH